MVWSLKAVFDRDLARTQVDQRAGNKKRSNAARAFFVQKLRSGLD